MYRSIKDSMQVEKIQIHFRYHKEKCHTWKHNEVIFQSYNQRQVHINQKAIIIFFAL